MKKFCWALIFFAQVGFAYRQGSIVTLYEYSAVCADLLFQWNQSAVKFLPHPERKNCCVAVIAIPFDAAVGPQKFIVGKKTLGFDVQKGQFKSEVLRVQPSKVVLSPADQQRAIEERDLVRAMYEEPPNLFYGNGRFIKPLDSITTSAYGTKRVFNGKMNSHHNGVDFRAKVGTPIQAAGAGRVRLARDLFYAGNLVLIDHGAGIFTNYAHLSEFDVKEGDLVQGGQVIGRSGATGRISGPHLHWGVRVQGVEANPLELLKLKLALTSSPP